MGSITTLRPSATSSGVGWTPSTGTLHGVTSDDNDATYATWGGSGSALILATPVDSPPAGERRHQVRLTARGEDGDAWWAVRLASGALTAAASSEFPTSPDTVVGSWGTGAPPDGPTILSTYVTGQSTGVRITELYLDVDCREAPTLTPQVIDGSGAVTTTVADTVQPVIHANAIDLDGLAARWFRYWVTLNGAIVWDTGVKSGAASDQQTSPLDNGTYVAHIQIWSTLGSNTEYPSDEETVTFTMAVGAVLAPDNPNVAQVPDSPLYEIEACIPDVTDLDGGVGYLEIQRVDCPYGGYLLLPGQVDSTQFASTPDTGPDPTDLELTVRAWRSDSWRPTGDETLAAKYNTVGDQRSWRLSLDADGAGYPALAGRPTFLWSTDGTAAGLIGASASERAPIDPYGFVDLRVHLDVDDGAGGWAVTYETKDGSGDWVQLGEVITGSGPTDMFDGSADFTVGKYGGESNRFTGRIYSVQVRDGRAGTILANPDFTVWPSGTETFTDGVGNLWTVQPGASIVSSQNIVSIAMLGPLVTDECATWTDYTIPRTGVAVTCDHAPEPCCSYYRARTVGRDDGNLRISAWSDAFDSGAPLGLIVMWPSTAASIPDGWSRVTDLDGRYPKGIATASTAPGTTGGAASHQHTVGTHNHDTSHLHTVTGNTSTAVGSVASHDGAVGNTAILASHTHTRPSTDFGTVPSGNSTPVLGSSNNDPARLEVIFIESDGTPEGVPDGALVITPDVSLSGWTDYANADGRFMKGAAAAGNGGATAASAIGNHVHSVAAHTHPGQSHTHTSDTSGAASSTLSLFAGPNSVVWNTAHVHLITTNAASTAALDSGGADNSAASSLTTNDPPYRNMRVKENTSGDDDLPVGMIGLWRSSLASVPASWEVCDGTSGTPDLTGVYPRGATASIGTTGGSAAGHTHTTPSHTHTMPSGHTHTQSISAHPGQNANVSATATVTVATGSHSHTAGSTNSTTPTVAGASSGTLASLTSEPLFEEVAFIQLASTPTPPPDPDLICMTWDDDEHLIRTLGPDGALWSRVLGKFEWTKERPFTVSTGVSGGRFVTSAPPGERNLRMVAAVESEAALAVLRAVLARPLVLISPSDSSEVWAAPVAESVRIVKVGRIRQLSAEFIGTGPQPPPQLTDVGS